MKRKTTPKGMLILAGLADRCTNIGRAGHFDLLPIPSDNETFRTGILPTLKADKTNKEIEETHRPEETRTVGVRCWICRHPQSKLLEPIYQYVHQNKKRPSTRTLARAQNLIDKIAGENQPLKFPWPEDKPFGDPETTATLEKGIHSKLEMTA